MPSGIGSLGTTSIAGGDAVAVSSLEIETADVLEWEVPDDLTVALINEP